MDGSRANRSIAKESPVSRSLFFTAALFVTLGCGSFQNQEARSSSRDRRDDVSQLARSVDSRAGQSQSTSFFPRVWNADHLPTKGKLELVATIDSPMLTGVTVSRTGRIFINFPKWGDKV